MSAGRWLRSEHCELPLRDAQRFDAPRRPGRRRADVQGVPHGRGDNQHGPRRHRVPMRNLPGQSGSQRSAHTLTRPRRPTGTERKKTKRKLSRRGAETAPTTLCGYAGSSLYAGTIMGMVLTGKGWGPSQGRNEKRRFWLRTGGFSRPDGATVPAPRALRMLQPTSPGPRYCGSGGW